MRIEFNVLAAAVAMIGLGAACEAARGAEAKRESVRTGLKEKQIRIAADRGLVFLQNDASQWRAQRKCASCHHGIMTAWVLAEATAQGYRVEQKTRAAIAAWAKERLKDIDKPRELHPKNPGGNVLSTPALYLAVMARVLPKQDALSADELRRVADHLVRYQEADGAWAWSPMPAANRRPPVLESDEVATLLTDAALGPFAAGDGKLASAVRESRAKGAEWLSKSKPTGTTQAAAFHLLDQVLSGTASASIEPEIAALVGRQQADGGWPQLAGGASDAYATGQALYVLNLAGLKRDRPEIERGLSFLVGTQRSDGSWPMHSRGQPGEKPAKNLQPIIYFGSTWATLALMRAAPMSGL